MPAFDTRLQAEGPGVFVIVPDTVMGELGGRRVPVRVAVNGHSWRTTTAVYGGVAMIALNKEARRGAGIEAGDRVTVELERDDDPRQVDVPEPLASALAHDAVARDAFASMSYSHRREYADWIADAKRDETRERRVAKALTMLREGRPLK